MVENRTLARSYAFLAPFYDWFVGPAAHASRRRSIAGLSLRGGEKVLLSGIGTGLDVPLLPADVLLVGVDLTPAMLAVARRRALSERRRVCLVVGDAQRLPLRDGTFDAGVLHLILAIVPDARPALSEAARCLKEGARLAVFDKFVPPGETPSLLRRLADLVTRRLATGFLTRFEDALAAAPSLLVEEDAHDLGGGFFRRIRVRKTRA